MFTPGGEMDCTSRVPGGRDENIIRWDYFVSMAAQELVET
jgi:hypothetical protein